MLAGGTDLYTTSVPVPTRLRQPVLDITALESQRAIRVEGALVQRALQELCRG
jgi:hypothetical protein